MNSLEKFVKHNLGEGQLDHSLGRIHQKLIVDGQASEVLQPGERTLHYPSFGKHTLSFREIKPLFIYERRGQKMLMFRSEAFPHHRYEFCIDGMTENEWSDIVETHSLAGKDERLMNNEQTCIFYALNLLFDAEGICPGPIITDDTSFTDGRQLNAFFDHFLDEYMTIPCKWSDVKKVNFPKSCVLAFMNDKEEIIHAVYCREGSEYNPKGYAFFSKNGLFTPIVVDSLKPILDTYSKYGSDSAEKIVVYTAQSF